MQPKRSPDEAQRKAPLLCRLQKLNHSVMRELFIMPTVDEISAQLAGSTVFSALDCSSSFWQLPIHTDDRALTCFITAYGIPCVIIDIDDILIHLKKLGRARQEARPSTVAHS